MRPTWQARRASVATALLTALAAPTGGTAQNVFWSYGTCVASRGGVCTANEVVVTGLSVAAIVDGCESPGDLATVSLDIDLHLTGPDRYDIGLFLGITGDAFGGDLCAVGMLPGSPPPFVHLNESPTNLCGDFDNAFPQLEDVALAELEIPCLDVNGDGLVDLPICLTWGTNPTSLPVCLTEDDLRPASPTQCRCASMNVLGLPSPSVIEVRKGLDPPEDPRRVDLWLDDALSFAGAGHLDTTGSLPVLDGNHDVAESAGQGTDLADFEASISCLDYVGRCTGDTTQVCVADGICEASPWPGVCDLSPRQVASCTVCNELAVAVPSVASQIVCTITNVRLPATEILVRVETLPPGDPQAFSFAASYDGAGFDLTDGQLHDSGALAPGSYTVSETVPANWELFAASCDDGSDPAAIGLDFLEVVTCTFSNRKVGIFASGFEVNGLCEWSLVSPDPGC